MWEAMTLKVFALGKQVVVLVKAELHSVGSGAVCIASELIGPFFAC